MADLTTLQREASSRFGFSAQHAGDRAALYERHKLPTYPRTDSKCLPEDYLGTVRGNLGGFAKANPSATLAPEVIAAPARCWIRIG